MKRSSGSNEIPGFYRDPKSGRYFKIPAGGLPLPASSANFSTCRRKATLEPSIPKFKSILNCLNSNQTGSIYAHRYQREVSSLRLQSVHPSRQYVYPISNKELTIRFLKGGVKHLYGLWESQMTGALFYAFGEFIDPAFEAKYYRIVQVSPQIAVADMCEGFSDPLCLLYVCNDFTSAKGTVWLISRLEGDHDAIRSSRFSLNSAVWCCCSNQFSSTYAVGIENAIFVHNCDSHLYTKKLKGQVYGVHFKQTGEIIHAVVNHGKLITVDTRVPEPVCHIKLNDYALTEVSLLDNENYVVCAGLKNFFCQVDLRMRRKTVDYLGENRSTLKIPFSFNEAHNLMCSTGSDNVTRLWSLREGGRPLKNIPPPIPGEDCRSWLMEDTSKISLYLASKNMTFIYEN